MLTKIFANSWHSTFESFSKSAKSLKLKASDVRVRSEDIINLSEVHVQYWQMTQSFRVTHAHLWHMLSRHAHWWWHSLCVVNICTDTDGTWAMQTNDCFSIFFYLEYSAGVLLFEDIYVLSLRKVCHIFWLIWSTKSRWMFFQTTFL